MSLNTLAKILVLGGFILGLAIFINMHSYKLQPFTIQYLDEGEMVTESFKDYEDFDNKVDTLIATDTQYWVTVE